MGSLKSQFRHLELHLAILADGIARGLPFTSKDIQSLTSRSASEGSSFFNVTLPLLGRAVDHGLVCGNFTSPVAFRCVKGSKLPQLFHSVFATVFDNSGALLDKPNVTAIFMLRQICLLQSRFVTEPTTEQSKLTVESFRRGQATLRGVRLNTDDPTLRIAQAILGYALRNLNLSRITPGHGPGVVHERRDHEERWRFTYWSARANKVYPYHEYGVQSLQHLRETSNSVVFLDRMTTKIALVPKDFRGPRLISVEMSALQYLQQGQMNKMMDYIDSHPLLRQSIRMRDQTRNQSAASKAYENDHATLDLSNASDTVSLPLVWFLLAKVPKLRRLLCRTRADFATYEGELIRICAMSPMGSAVCFPIETLVFWSLSLATMYRLSGHDRVVLNRGALFELSSSLRVFGDDIILPRIYLDSLMYTLTSVGCQPNMSKTCWMTPFRESCGTEWFGNIPVSITRNKKVRLHEDDKIDQYPYYVDLQRRLWLGGLYNSAKLLAHWTSCIAPVSYQFRERETSGLQTNSWQAMVFSQQKGQDDHWSDSHRSDEQRHHLVNFVPSVFSDVGQFDRRLRIRWNDKLHRMEFRVPCFCQKARDWRHGGYSRLLARCLHPSFDRIAIRDLTVRLRWRAFPPGSWSFMTRSIAKDQPKQTNEDQNCLGAYGKPVQEPGIP
jgi:hypothetical protein